MYLIGLGGGVVWLVGWRKVQCEMVWDFGKADVKLESRVSGTGSGSCLMSSHAPPRDESNGTAHSLVGRLCGRLGRFK
jgi:hypothetical protein